MELNKWNIHYYVEAYVDDKQVSAKSYYDEGSVFLDNLLGMIWQVPIGLLGLLGMLYFSIIRRTTEAGIGHGKYRPLRRIIG